MDFLKNKMNIKEEIKNKIVELFEAGTSEGVKRSWEKRQRAKYVRGKLKGLRTVMNKHGYGHPISVKTKAEILGGIADRWGISDAIYRGLKKKFTPKKFIGVTHRY